MFYESLIILNISTLNFSEGVPASVLCKDLNFVQTHKCSLLIMGLHIFEIKL